MTILILYATTEGQTRKVARRAAAHLALHGKSTEVLSVADSDGTDLTDYEAVILAASVHAGRYQGDFLRLVTAQRETLAKVRHVFLSVSLSAASSDPEDAEGIAAVVDAMAADTGWTPAEVVHVAGAFRFNQYDFLKSWAMRWIAAERGRATRPDIKLGICGEHGGDPASIAFCEEVGLDYVSASPYRVPIARLAAAQAALA